MLKEVKAPRIILVGGSNLTFGLDSRIIKDSLRMNPINAGLHASIGLKYMLKNTLRFIHKGDIIVVSPEYHQFYDKKADGEIELLTMVFDVAPETKDLLEPRQYFNLIKYIPKYVGSKLNPIAYFLKGDTSVSPYDRKALNNYGDAYKHWSLPGKPIASLTLDGDLDDGAFQSLIEFNNKIKAKGARLFIAFPAFEDVAFDAAKGKIKVIQKRLIEEKFTLLGSPERYRLAGTMFYDTQYHLTKAGAQFRTELLIQDLKKALN